MHLLLHNLVYLNEKSPEQEFQEKKLEDSDVIYMLDDSDSDSSIVVNTKLTQTSTVHQLQVPESEFLLRFDVLTVLNSYLDQLIEYLVLYYCCFDSKLWIGTFYPFIEAGIDSENVKCCLLNQIKHTQIKQV